MIEGAKVPDRYSAEAVDTVHVPLPTPVVLSEVASAAQPEADADRPHAAHAPGPRRGRRRDPTIDTRVATTVVELYAQFGWAGLTFYEVARRARVGKAALYLRWASKEDLLLDSMASVRVRRIPGETDGLRDDLVAIGQSLLTFYSSPSGLAFLRFYVECRYVPGLEDRWRKQHATPMFLETRALVRDAIARGELPASTSPTIVLDALAGAIVNHVLSTPPELFAEMTAKSPRYLEELVDFVLTAAASPAR
jgi:AcrR family transcriptional regulator